jgi:hypothetical protein
MREADIVGGFDRRMSWFSGGDLLSATSFKTPDRQIGMMGA